MDDLQIWQEAVRQSEPLSSNAAGDHPLRRNNRALSLGAAALGAFALGAAAIGAVAIGSLAIGAFTMKRGRVRKLTVDELEVQRLHVGHLVIDSGTPLRDSSALPL